MTHNKRTKKSRQRGSHTHGCGSKKKNRGYGNSGGSGMAGTGKRADQKKPSIWKDLKYFGKFGFKHIHVKIKEVNIEYLEAHLNELLKTGKIKKENDFYVVNLTDLGFNKLLATGIPKNKFKIAVDFASQNSIEKIAKVGGEVVLLKDKKVKKVREKVQEKTAE